MRLSWQEVLLDLSAGSGVSMTSVRRFKALSKLLCCGCIRCAAVLVLRHISMVHLLLP